MDGNNQMLLENARLNLKDFSFLSPRLYYIIIDNSIMSIDPCAKC